MIVIHILYISLKNAAIAVHVDLFFRNPCCELGNKLLLAIHACSLLQTSFYSNLNLPGNGVRATGLR